MILSKMLKQGTVKVRVGSYIVEKANYIIYFLFIVPEGIQHLWYDETRVMSSGFELKARFKIQESQFKSTSHGFKTTSLISRVRSSTLQVTSSNPQVTSLNLRVTSSNPRVQE